MTILFTVLPHLRSFSQSRWVLRLGGEKFISIAAASGRSGDGRD